MKKQNQQIKFPSNNETFECKNCIKHVLFDLAIMHLIVFVYNNCEKIMILIPYLLENSGANKI